MIGQPPCISGPSKTEPGQEQQPAMPKVRFPSGHTEHGRLLPMQKLLAQYLNAKGVEHPVVVDVGIGLGAHTLVDLAKELKAAGLHSATIIGVDADRVVLKTADVFLGKAKAKGAIPEGVSIRLEHGDICAEKESPYSLESIVRKHTGYHDRLADLCVSSNLLGGLSLEEQPKARESLCRSISRDGLVGLGWGSAEDLLRLDILRGNPGNIVQQFTFELWTEERHTRSFLSTLLGMTQESTEREVLSLLRAPTSNLVPGR